MLNPVINWFGSNKDAALFRRFLIPPLGYDMKATGDVLRIMTVIAGIDATGEEKDEMVARIVGYPDDLDWRDYK